MTARTSRPFVHAGLSLAVALFVALVGASTAFAEKFVYYYGAGSLASNTVNFQEGEAAGKVEWIKATYDNISKYLTWDVKFQSKVRSDGQMSSTDGFWLVMSDGPNPKSMSGQYAFIFFDAGVSSDGQAALTIYDYDGTNGPDSWKTSAKLYSSRNPGSRVGDSTAKLKVLSVDRSNGRFRFEMDVASLNNRPGIATWMGAGFSANIGVWLHAFDRASTAYTNGYLTSFTAQDQGYFDTTAAHCTTNGIECDASTTATATVPVGTTFTKVFRGYDKDTQKIKVTYSGTPSLPPAGVGSFSVPTGQVLTTSFDTTKNAYKAESTFTFKPTVNESGKSYTIYALFEEQNATAAMNTYVQCPVSVTVPVQRPPTCNAGGPYTNLACQGSTTTIALDGSRSTDPDGNPITFQWSTSCASSSLQNPTSARATLQLGRPGMGVPESCFVALTVNDGIQSSSCSLPVTVNSCQVDCLGQPGGTAKLDQCGVCNGNNSCFDCKGTPNGTATVDRCGVCGGTNSCVDCKGDVNGTAKVDHCGVCGGDGTSCSPCEQTNVANLLFALDGQALAQKKLVQRAANRLIAASPSRANRKYVAKVTKEATALYLESWTFVWSIPQVMHTCGTTPFCVEASNEKTIDAYLLNSLKLKKLAENVIASLQKAHGSKAKITADKRLLKEAQGLHEKNVRTSGSVPKSRTVCG